MRRPFSLGEARSVGVSRTSLRGKAWRRLGSNLYCWSGLDEDPWKLLSAWRVLLPKDAVFAGRTAAWLHGIETDPCHPIEVIVGPNSGMRSRSAVTVHRTNITESETVAVRGLPATTIRRTLIDLCCRLPAVEALIAFDAAIRLRRVEKSMLIGTGSRRFRYLAVLAEPAESPMETRLRWLLLQSGLPRPEVQRDLHDANGRFVGRADLYYAAARLVIEYDGGNHRDRLVEDNRRQNLIANAGFRMLRFTAADLFARPSAVTSQVRTALSIKSARPFGDKRASFGI